MATSNNKKKMRLEDLTVEQRKKLLMKPCKTREELSKFIQLWFGFYLPDFTVSRFADTNPLDIVWEVYDICVNKNNPNDIDELLYVASRGGGKTLGMAIAELLVLLHDQRDVVHVGAVMAQAKRCYEYQTKFLLSPKIRPIIENKSVPLEGRILQKLNMEKSIFKIKDDQHSIEVLPCTLSATNGPHVPFVCIGGKTKVMIDNSDRVVSENRDRVQVSAGKLYRLIKEGKDVNAISFNHNTGDIESKPILAAYDNGKRERIKIEFDSGKPLWCTPDHKIWCPVDNKYKEAQDFAVGDKLLGLNKKKTRFSENQVQPNYVVPFDPKPAENPDPHSVLLGSMLGDGGIYGFWGNNKYLYYAENHGPAQIDYAMWKKDVLKSMFTFKQKFTEEQFENFDRQALAVWYMDDGYKNKFATHSFSVDQQRFLQEKLKNTFGIETDIVRSKDKYNVLKLRAPTDYAKMYNEIYHLLIPSMGYKLDNFRGVYTCNKCNKNEFRVNTNNCAVLCSQCISDQSKFTNLKEIKSIEHIKSKRTVYDFNVKDNHNFFAGGVLVHNCTDELDTISGEGLKAFKEIAGMLDSKGGKRALRVGISTRKSRYGLMNKMMEDADNAGRTVRKWTAFEFTERCPDSRSGTIPTDSYHILDEMEVISEAEYKLKDDKKKKEYTKHTLPGEKCLKCPAASICLGDAKNQTSQSWMLKPINDLIQKVKSEGADWALAQLMNLKPSMEGIIYKEFNEKINVKNWNDMWETLTGTAYPGECTHDIFVKKCHSMNLQCYGGVDWGWSNPNTVVYFFVDKKDNIYVVRADGMTYVSQPEWVNYIKHKYHHMYRCQLYFPDIADQGAVTEMRKAGLPVSSDNDKAINTGIQVIKKYLKVPGSNETKIHLAKETTGPLIEEFLTYHFKTAADGTITEVPESESDHWLDALRYAMTMLFGKGTLVIGNNMSPEEDNKVTDDRGYYHRAPTAEEFAKANNLELGMDQDTSKLGKSGKLSDLDDDDDDWGGDGGFLWSL